MADFEDLRRRAEKKLDETISADSPEPSAPDLTRVIEELRIHQVELEIQNQDLREAQQQLEISREEYRVLYDSAPVGYFTLDPAGTILAANLTGAAQLGVERPALLNQNLTLYVAHADRDKFYLHLRRLMTSLAPQTSELRLISVDGSPFKVQLESTPAMDLNKGIPQIRTVMIDITARKKLEAALAQYRNNLEVLVSVRTAALIRTSNRLQQEIDERTQAQDRLQASHAQLEKTLAELKAAQEQVVRQERLAAVGQLAAGIAHDFNNILTVIAGHAALLELEVENLSPGGEYSIETIARQGERATHLIRQILDFTRQSLRQPRLIELGDFLHYTCSFLKRTIPENIRIGLQLASEPCVIEADPTQLQQLLTNLAVNARDAMPEGGLIEFRLAHIYLEPDQTPPSPELRPGEWVRLTVADGGVGISPDIRPHIFEPFFTTKDIGQGTGLGLAQVYGIIQQHQGYIDVESRVGTGSTFTLYFPPGQVTEVESTPVVAPEQLQGQGEVVLVVEDDPAVLNVITRRLEKLNYQTLSAANGQEALAVYRANQAHIAVVLTDLVMPEMDGIELFQVLQAEAPHVKVIILSGYPQQASLEALLAQGVIERVQKPPEFGALAQTLHRALQSSRHS